MQAAGNEQGPPGAYGEAAPTSKNPPPAAIWDKRSVKQSIGYISLVVRDFRRYQDRGVVFVREPKTEGYGTVAVFQDLYGKLWDLLQPS